MTTDCRPVLAAKAKLRFDRITANHLLLFPEQGLILNPSAHDVLRLCTGAHTVGMIIDTLSKMHADASPTGLAQDVWDFLRELENRGLICQES